MKCRNICTESTVILYLDFEYLTVRCDDVNEFCSKVLNTEMKGYYSMIHM